jgi:hypothetical protein
LPIRGPGQAAGRLLLLLLPPPALLRLLLLPLLLLLLPLLLLFLAPPPLLFLGSLQPLQLSLSLSQQLLLLRQLAIKPLPLQLKLLPLRRHRLLQLLVCRHRRLPPLQLGGQHPAALRQLPTQQCGCGRDAINDQKAASAGCRTSRIAIT